MTKVAVIGGGIIGIPTAKAILEDYPDVSVTVYSSALTPETTADVSAGFIFPYLYGNSNPELMNKWTKETIAHIRELASKNEPVATSISPLSGFLLWKSEVTDLPESINIFSDARKVEKKELKELMVTEKEYSSAWFLTSWTLRCLTYLPYLVDELKSKGVKFIQEHVNSLDEIAERGYDVVINCTGIGAKALVKDQSLCPIRGQVLEVDAPWIKHFYLEIDGDAYALPRIDTVIVGGTHSDSNDLTVNSSDTEVIWEEALKLLPSLKYGKIVGEKVGLRPGRSAIRIEAELKTTKSGTKYVLIHNYGHGGSGVTVHWGCAKEASSLLLKYVGSSPIPKL